MKHKIFITPKIVRADGSIDVLPRQQNMITDYGLKKIRDGTPLELALSYFHIGTGSTDHKRQSGDNTLSCSISTLTSSVPFFVAADASNKRAIQFNDNTHCRIDTFVSDTEVLINEERTYTDVDAIIWNTELVSLDTHLMTSGTNYGTHMEDYGTVYDYINNGVDDTWIVINSFRTKRFNFVDAGAVITEVGWGSTSSTSELYGRLVLESPIAMNAAEMLLLKIETVRVVPAGFVSSDPIFGVPARIEHVFDNYGMMLSAPAIDYANNSYYYYAAPQFAPKDEFSIRIISPDAGTVVREGNFSSKLSKPYVVKFPTFSYSGVVMDEVTSVFFTNDTYDNNFRFGYVYDQGVVPELREDQLLQFTPESLVDRDFPAYPGTSLPSLPSHTPHDFSSYAGEEFEMLVNVLGVYEEFDESSEDVYAITKVGDNLVIITEQNIVYHLLLTDNSLTEVKTLSELPNDVCGLAWDGTNYYVAVYGNGVYRYDSDWTNPYQIITASSDNARRNLCYDPVADKLYILDYYYDRLREIDRVGETVSSILYDLSLTNDPYNFHIYGTTLVYIDIGGTLRAWNMTTNSSLWADSNLPGTSYGMYIDHANGHVYTIDDGKVYQTLMLPHTSS